MKAVSKKTDCRIKASESSKDSANKELLDKLGQNQTL